MGLSSFNFFSGGLRKTIFAARVRFGHSRSSEVIDFGTNRKRVCDFLLVCHSNLGPVLHHFRDIAGFCAHDPTPIPPYFGVVPFGPDRPRWDQCEQVP